MRAPRLLHEPLVQFLALGAALFLLFQWSGTGPGSNRIVLTPGLIEHLTAGFMRTWQRPPTEAEIKGLIDDHVREEIAVREATAMGLDRDDTIIRRRLRQKLEFLVEDAVETVQPTDVELESWLENHADAFRIEPQIEFRQVYLSRERRGGATEADAERLLARVTAAGPDAATDQLGDPTMLPPEFPLAPVSDVSRVFGPDFAERLLAIEPGQWTGPIESGFGIHLVLVRRHSEGSLPDLSRVRPAVEREFLAERRKQELNAMYERLLEKYVVVVERPKAGMDDSTRGLSSTSP